MEPKRGGRGRYNPRSHSNPSHAHNPPVPHTPSSAPPQDSSRASTKKHQRGGRRGDGAVNLEEQAKIDLADGLQAFKDGDEEELVYPPTLSNVHRKYVHDLCAKLGLTSKSRGSGASRFLTVKRELAPRHGRRGEDDAGAIQHSIDEVALPDGTADLVRNYLARYPDPAGLPAHADGAPAPG